MPPEPERRDITRSTPMRLIDRALVHFLTTVDLEAAVFLGDTELPVPRVPLPADSWRQADGHVFPGGRVTFFCDGEPIPFDKMVLFERESGAVVDEVRVLPPDGENVVLPSGTELGWQFPGLVLPRDHPGWVYTTIGSYGRRENDDYIRRLYFGEQEQT